MNSDTFHPSLVSSSGVTESESRPLSVPQTVDQPDRKSASPPPNCPICLTECVNYSTTDVCKHRFCFECIKQWAKVKNECPLCKKRFRSIYHNFESATKYSQLSVGNARGHSLADSIFHSYDLPINGNRFLGFEYVPRYVYSTTLRINEHEQNSLHEYFLRNPSIRFVDFNVGGVQPQTHVHRVYNRFSSVSTTNFRRSIYLFSWWSMVFPDSVERVTREDYVANPDFEEKLRPWLLREAVALLGGDVPLQSRFMDVIYRCLRNHSITTRFFMIFVEQCLQNRSLHFMHELCIFLRSRLDIETYDNRIRFTDAPDPSSSIFSEIVNNRETPLNLSTEPQSMASVLEVLNHNRNRSQQSSTNRSYQLPGHSGNFRHSPMRPEDIMRSSMSPEVIVIDSNTDDDSDIGDLSDSDVVYQGTREIDARPVEVVELLSDSESDSVSTTSIFLNSGLPLGPRYHPSNTITIDSSPNLSSSSSPLSSSDESGYPIPAVDVTKLQLAIDPISGLSSTSTSTSTSSTSTLTSLSSTSSTSTLTPQPSPASETLTPSTSPPIVTPQLVKVEHVSTDAIQSSHNTETASTSAAACLATSSSGYRNSMKDLLNSLLFRKRSRSTSSSSSESSAASSNSNSSTSVFNKYKRVKRCGKNRNHNVNSQKKSQR